MLDSSGVDVQIHFFPASKDRIIEKLQSTVKLFCNAMAADDSFRKPLSRDLTPMVIVAADDRVPIPPRPALGPAWRGAIGL
jgi:hypothetical protein